MNKIDFSNEEKKKIMDMTPEEWQEYKVAHKEYEQMSDLYTELSLKLEAEKEEYLNEGKKYDKEIADHFKEKNLAEYEKIQNEIIAEEKKEYLKRLEQQELKNKEKSSSFKKININHILIVLIAIAVILVIIMIVVDNTKTNSYFSDEEIAQLDQIYNKSSDGAVDEASGKYFAANENDENKAQDMVLEADSKSKLYYEGNEIGLLCYSRNINSAIFIQKQSNDGLIELESKKYPYYVICLNNDTNKFNRTINNVVIDYDNLKYLNNNDVYLQYEDFVINRNTLYDDVKKFFASKTSDIVETQDDKKHMTINVDKYKIVIDSYQDDKIKPVGTVDKLTVYVNR